MDRISFSCRFLAAPIPREAEGFLQLFELVSLFASSEEHDGLFMAPVLHSFLPTGGGFEHAANLSASDMESLS